MPGGDRTGPMGAGPMTGRGLGNCAGYNVPEYMSPAFGRGFGGGRGRGFGRGFHGGGRGRRNQYYTTGLPGWARAYDYPYSRSTVNPAGPGAAVDSKAAREAELVNLTEQAQYLKGVLEDIEKRANELQK